MLRLPGRPVPEARAGRDVPVTIALVAFVAAAWLALALVPHSLLHDPGAHGLPGTAAVFLAGWSVMAVAMMLPTTVPLLRAVGRLAGSRPRRRRLGTLVVAGFLVSWVAAGVPIALAGAGVRALPVGWPLSVATSPLLAAVVVGLAGLYQFSPLKVRCLTACRTPGGFLYRGWHGDRPRVDALRIGAAYGWSCIGCCWALMALMSVLGLMNLGWMLALTVVMVVEKTFSQGQRLRVPLGVGLLVAAVALGTGWFTPPGAPAGPPASHQHMHMGAPASPARTGEPQAA